MYLWIKEHVSCLLRVHILVNEPLSNKIKGLNRIIIGRKRVKSSSLVDGSQGKFVWFKKKLVRWSLIM